ncbi:MAG: RNB domain-containing ribonuclease, partial [Micrococcaceae bacterium]|nr:RNB domain-containing ribonuclease [Micrococcaceae bacterium]
ASLRIPSQDVECIEGTYQLVSDAPLPVEDWNAQISLMTGMAAAEIMLKAKVGLLRTMPAPAQKDIDVFRLQAQTLGATWAPEQPYGEFLRSLDLADPRQLALMHQATSLFRGATYSAFDGELPEETAQAAIAAPYAHTTAPLRRLVDRFALLVCSYASTGQEVPAAVREVLPSLPELMNDSNRVVNKIERAAIDTVEAASLAHRLGERFSAVTLTGSTEENGNGKSGGILQLDSPAVTARYEGSVPPGSRVEVELVDADLDTRKVRFRILDS